MRRMSDFGTQYVLRYVHEPKIDTIGRISRRPARGVRQPDLSLIAGQFPLAPFRYREKSASPVGRVDADPCLRTLLG
jgi:hypothetical protein